MATAQSYNVAKRSAGTKRATTTWNSQSSTASGWSWGCWSPFATLKHAIWWWLLQPCSPAKGTFFTFTSPGNRIARNLSRLLLSVSYRTDITSRPRSSSPAARRQQYQHSWDRYSTGKTGHARWRELSDVELTEAILNETIIPYLELVIFLLTPHNLLTYYKYRPPSNIGLNI
jgi:hypothetical protein